MPSKCDDGVHQLLSGMKKGMEFIIVKNDRLIRKLAAKLLRRAGLEDADLQTVIAPKHFRTVLNSVKALAGHSDVDHSYSTPSLAINIGHDLKRCATLESIAVEEENPAVERRAQAFADLYTTEWNDEISGSARRLLQTRKMNKPQLLPLAADVAQLTKYLKTVQRDSLSVIEEKAVNAEFCSAFRSLEESILAQLILFNRRRQGEVSKLLMSQISSLAEPTYSQDVYTNLSPLEKELVNSFTRIEIPGKRNNRVPLLFTSELKSAVSRLTDKQIRHDAGVDDHNMFVFAVPNGSQGYIRGSDVLRNFAVKCGATNPENLRSTALRKHVATMSQVMNLKHNELDQLAAFMGHDVRIHREFYRLPHDVTQTAKVAKILISMERGSIGQLRGKTLDEIDIGADDGISCLLKLMAASVYIVYCK